MISLSEHPNAILQRKNVETACGNQDSLPAAGPAASFASDSRKGTPFALLLQGAGVFVDARRGYYTGMSDSAESVAQAFVRAINWQDVVALAALIASLCAFACATFHPLDLTHPGVALTIDRSRCL